MNKSILSFFLPQLDGSAFAVLQVVFALVFLAAVIAIPLWLGKSARASQWERRLQAIEGKDDAPAVYDTPEALSEAIATSPERWADIAPSLLLVFGLLGTFIGIGLALTEAAGLLGGADALGSLTPVMDALGTKFKISTWGIIAFLFLKIWNMVSAHEHARLAFSASALKARATRQAQAATAAQQQLVDAVVQSARALQALQQAEAQRAHVRHAELIDALQRLAPRAQDSAS